MNSSVSPCLKLSTAFLLFFYYKYYIPLPPPHSIDTHFSLLRRTSFHLLRRRRQSRDVLDCSRAELIIRASYDSELTEASLHGLFQLIFSPLKLAQKKFERRGSIDEAALKYFTDVTLRSVSDPTLEELELLKRSLACTEETSTQAPFHRNAGSLKKYPSLHMFSRRAESSNKRWAKTVGDIDEAAELILAWLWSWCSYERMERHKNVNGSLARQTDASFERRSQTVSQEMKLPGIANRKGATNFCWFDLKSSWKNSEASYAIAFEPVPMTSSSESNLVFTSNAVECTTFGGTNESTMF